MATSKCLQKYPIVCKFVAPFEKKCTLGEISQALENAWGRHIPSSSVVQGAYGASFTGSGGTSSSIDSSSTDDEDGSSIASEMEKEYHSVLREVELFEKVEGRRPRILVAKMGQDGHDRGAK
eukprot:1978653-Ditylum_brightwellii.AAC.1